MRKFTELRTAPPRRMTRTAGLFTVAAMSLLLASCGDRPLSTMDPESPIAEQLDTFLVILLLVCAVVFVLVQGSVIYMARRFGVKAPEDESQLYPDEEFPEQVHGNMRLEIGWTIAPTIIMAIVAFFTLGLLFQLDDVTPNANQRIDHVDVVGQQWWWEFHYYMVDGEGPGPHIVTAGELVLPEDEEIQLYTTSRDVIHSFWIPTLNGKRDAVPGQANPWTIEAGNQGRFPGECTEFCGLSHAYMEKYVVGISLADFDTWAANQMAPAELPVVVEGEAISDEDAEILAGWDVFSNQCVSCHMINGLTETVEGELDTFAVYGKDGEHDHLPTRIIPADTQVSGAAPNLTHLATRSTFAGGIFDLYLNPDDENYLDLAADGTVNRGDLEAWIINAPEVKANAWDSPGSPRGMRPFDTLSAEDVDNLVAFLMSLD